MLLSSPSRIGLGKVPSTRFSLYPACTDVVNRQNLNKLASKTSTLAITALLSLAVLPPCAHSQTTDFTIIALPDTQYYSESYPQTFTAQTQWIVNNASTLNVQMVLGLGDVVNTATNVWEYQNANTSVNLLDNANIPYLLAIGNHDYSNSNDVTGRTSETTNFNTYFGPSRYRNYSWYKGQYPAGSNENFYGVTTINGKTYLFLMLEFYPRDSALAWADSVLAAYPSAEVIVVTHAYVYIDNSLVSRCDQINAQTYNVGADNNGDSLWSKFISQHSNISVVLSGHFAWTDSTAEGVGTRTDLGVNGNIVNQMLSDYQEMTNGGNGYLRILNFSPSQNKISVKTYSPTLNAYLTNSKNQFTLQWHSTGSNSNGTGVISGVVKDVSTCNVISGATVSTTGASQSTQSNGNFSLSVPTPRQYTVNAQASGHFATTQSLQAWTGYPEFSKYFLSTQQPGSISGTVSDPSGQAISGATVSFSGGTTTTGSNGSYSFLDVLVGSYTVTAWATGYSTANTQNVAVNAGVTTRANLTLTSTATGTISGTVLNSSGVAIAGASVSYGGGSTTTAGNGTYTLLNVPVGTQNVTASAAGYQNSTQANVTVTANTTTTVTFTLTGAGSQTYSISGSISPATNGGGASVTLTGPAPVLVQSAHGSAATGNSSAVVSFGAASGAGNTIVVFGRFGGATVSSISDNQAGGSNSYTSAAGPTPWGVSPNPTDRWAQVFVAKNVTGGSVLTITVTLAGSSTHPIYLAAVEYSGADPANPVNATAVGTGKVSQNGAPATANLNTTVPIAQLVATGWDSNESYASTGNGTGYTTDAVAGAPSLTGGPGWANLTEDRTAGTPGTWNAATGSAPEVDDWAIQLVALAAGHSRTVTADASGNFVFPNLSNGVYAVTPAKSGSIFTPANQSVTVNGGNITGTNFTATAAAGAIAGTVTNSSGTVIAGATLSYTGGSTTSASNGTYTLPNVPVGTVTVTATAAGYQNSAQSATVTANATTTLNFTMSTGAGTITGTVTNSGGTPISGATVSYSGGSTTSASNGSYTLANVQVGTLTVTAAAIGYQNSAQSATVTANTTTTLNFTLSPPVATTYSISGTISPASVGSGTSLALSGAVPVLVQSAHGSSATGSSSATVSFGAAAGAGHTLVLFTRVGGATISSVTDSQSGGTNTYTSVLGPTQWGVSPNPTDRWAQVFVAKNITGGSILTITVTLAGSSTHPIYVAALEYSGVDPVNPVNATAVGTGKVSQNGAPATGNLTTTVPNSKLVATSWDSNESYAATGNGTGYTSNTAAGAASLTGGPGWANLTEDNTAASAGTWNATTSSAPEVDEWAIQLVALTPAASQTLTADVNGNYSFASVSNGTYMVTPSKSGASFTPPNQSATVNGANVTGINFSGSTAGPATYSISGTISPASVGSGTSLALSGAVPVLLQSAHGSSVTGSSSATVSFGATAGAGHTIVLFSRMGGSTISSVTDNQSGGTNTYTSVLGPTQWGVSPNPTDRWAQVFVAKNITGGSILTITVTLAGGSTHPVYLAALEYSGVDPVNPVNATAIGTGKVSQNGAPTTSNLTTTVANSKLVASSWDSNESYASTGNGTGYTTDTAAGAASLTGGPGWANLTEDSTAAAPGTWKATTLSAPEVDDWAIQLIALTPASSQTATADVNGNYSFSNVSNGAYTITPSKPGHTFTPPNQSTIVNGANVTAVNFTGN